MVVLGIVGVVFFFVVFKYLGLWFLLFFSFEIGLVVSFEVCWFFFVRSFVCIWF